jgi:hypothetical protein
MTGSKPVALPLGYAPKRRAGNISELGVSMQRRNVTDVPLFVYNLRMVDPSMPWSLKGISEEAREFAKQSADGSHTPVGAWLSAVIRSAAAQEAGTDQPPDTFPVADRERSPAAPQAAEPPAPAGRHGSGAFGGSTIERAAQFVDDFDFEPKGPARDVDLINDPARLHEELLALERRLEESETATDENLAPLVDEIERVKTRLDAIKKH